jgi:hypothetical protein
LDAPRPRRQLGLFDATMIIGVMRDVKDGFLALENNTTGFSNTATGFNALVFNTTGRGSVWITKHDDGSLKSPACSCVSIALPAESYTRITARCDRLRNFAYPIAFATAFGPAYHSHPKWQRIGDQIDTTRARTA